MCNDTDNLFETLQIQQRKHAIHSDESHVQAQLALERVTLCLALRSETAFVFFSQASAWADQLLGQVRARQCLKHELLGT